MNIKFVFVLVLLLLFSSNSAARLGDFNENGILDFLDLAFFKSLWLSKDEPYQGIEGIITVYGASLGCKKAGSETFLDGAVVNGGEYTDISEGLSGIAQNETDGRASVSPECESGATTTPFNAFGEKRRGFTTVRQQILKSLRGNKVSEIIAGVITPPTDPLHAGGHILGEDGVLIPLDPLKVAKNKKDVMEVVNRLSDAGDLLIEQGIPVLYVSLPSLPEDIPNNTNRRYGFDIQNFPARFKKETNIIIPDVISNSMYRRYIKEYKKMVNEKEGATWVGAFDERTETINDGIHLTFGTNRRVSRAIWNSVLKQARERF